MNKTIFQLFFAAIILMMVTSCGSISSMQKKHSESVSYQSVPDPLTVKADKINVTINTSISPKYFKKNAVVFFQPVLQYDEKSIQFKPLVLKGENVKGNGIEVSYTKNNMITYTEEIVYKQGMETAKITFNPVAYKTKQVNETNRTHKDAQKNKFAITLGNVTIVDGINNTSERISIKEGICFIDREYVKNTEKTNMATLYFSVNSAVLDWNFKLNKDSEARKFVDALVDSIVKKSVPKQILINAWSSPEGEESLNIELSKKRAETTIKLVNNILDEGLSIRAKNENIVGANIAEYIKEAKKNIIITTNSLIEDKENVATEMLSWLRRSEISFYYTEKQFESEWITLNNNGATSLQTGNIADAKRYFGDAQKLVPDNVCLLNNLGLLSIAAKDYASAANYFTKAIQGGNATAKANMPIINLKTGNYAKAVEELASYPCTYNLAFALLLTGQTENAIKTLDCCVNQTAEVNYLRAVCYARLDKIESVLTNIKTASTIQPDYKTKAKTDIEFKKFWNIPDFKNIVQ